MAPSQGEISAILQARMSSSRLPGKVLKPILGKPMMSRQIERIARARNIDRLIVATSCDPSDDPIAALCGQTGVAYFRGDLADVLGRYHATAREFSCAHVMRLTADCPLADPDVLDNLVQLYRSGGHDYVSNTLHRTHPRGLDAELFSADVLTTAAAEAADPFEREHVTPFILRRPERFTLGNLEQKQDMSALRWTVDWQEDFEFVEAVYEVLYEKKPDFGMMDIVNLLDKRPDILCILDELPSEAFEG